MYNFENHLFSFPMYLNLRYEKSALLDASGGVSSLKCFSIHATCIVIKTLVKTSVKLIKSFSLIVMGSSSIVEDCASKQ